MKLCAMRGNQNPKQRRHADLYDDVQGMLGEDTVR